MKLIFNVSIFNSYFRVSHVLTKISMYWIHLGHSLFLVATIGRRNHQIIHLSLGSAGLGLCMNKIRIAKILFICTSLAAINKVGPPQVYVADYEKVIHLDAQTLLEKIAQLGWRHCLNYCLLVTRLVPFDHPDRFKRILQNKGSNNSAKLFISYFLFNGYRHWTTKKIRPNMQHFVFAIQPFIMPRSCRSGLHKVMLGL